MSSMLERIKSKVRGKSRERGSGGTAASPQTSLEKEVPKPPTIPSQFQTLPRTSLENSAFHVTAVRGVRKSADDDDPYQKRVAETNHSPTSPRRQDFNVPRKDDKVGDIIPDRKSSRVVIENSPQSRQYREKDSVQPDPAKPDKGAGNRDTVTLANTNMNPPTTPKSQNNDDSVVTSTATQPLNSDPHMQSRLAPSTPEKSLPVHRNPVQPTTLEKSSSGTRGDDAVERGRATEGVVAREHLTLPQGFNLNNTEQTHVLEHQRPAVTHERIIKQRTEIIQEAITRDIHYHHYYTYLQPVRVVEVLPPKHYFLNPETGVKTEIAAPPGWELPASMMPVSPDYSSVQGSTRHYLVNEEHPHGILEEPSLKHESDYENLRGAAREQKV